MMSMRMLTWMIVMMEVMKKMLIVNVLELVLNPS